MKDHPALVLIIPILFALSACQAVTPANGEDNPPFTETLPSPTAAHTAMTAASPSPTGTSPASPTIAPTPLPATPSATFTPTDTTPLSTPTLYPERNLHIVTDETGAISATISVAWGETRSAPWTDDQGQVIGTTFIASSDVDAFLDLQEEGIAISVSRRLGKGYIQLLDEEYQDYLEICNDPFYTYWDFQNEYQRGKYFVLDNCAGVNNSWLSVLSVVNVEDPGAYVARVLAYDLEPIFGEDFRDLAMQFQVDPDKLP